MSFRLDTERGLTRNVEDEETAGGTKGEINMPSLCVECAEEQRRSREWVERYVK